MKSAAFKEAVTHHTLAKQKKDDGQEDYQQELSNSERGWLLSCRIRRIQISHQSPSRCTQKALRTGAIPAPQ